MHISSTAVFTEKMSETLAMVKPILIEFKKAKLQSNFSLSTIIHFEPFHHWLILWIIDNLILILKLTVSLWIKLQRWTTGHPIGPVSILTMMDVTMIDVTVPQLWFLPEIMSIVNPPRWSSQSASLSYTSTCNCWLNWSWIRKSKIKLGLVSLHWTWFFKISQL